MTITEKPASEVMRDALESIALAGMSGTGQESEEGMTAWHARRAWEFIGIAARAITAANAVSDPQATDPAWRPIGTAPKDGRKIIVTYANRNGLKRTVMACWLTDEAAAETDTDDVGLEEGWYECIDNWNDYTEIAIHEGEPTHWMPLPAAPEAKQ